MKQPATKLTYYEWRGLASRFNLADGHPRQNLTVEQQNIFAKSSQLLETALKRNELETKKRFERAFFGLAGQSSVEKLEAPLAQYSGSMAIELMANYLRLHKKSVTFVHPAFDGIADTLKRHGIPLKAMGEEELFNLTAESPAIATDTLYLICPNNPTGRYPSKAQFAGIVAYCKKHHILLIIDFCFRFFGDLWDYDQYALMQDAGIDFITTEDTGKTLPAADMKVGMVLSSKSIYAQLKDVSEDFLLGVSPFVFELLSQYLALEQRAKKRVLSQDIADTNRAILRQILKGSPLQPVDNDARMSVEWLRLPEGWRATDFAEVLHKQNGIQVLPGEQFYWNQHEYGRHYIRIALLREPAYFHDAAGVLRQSADNYTPSPKILS